VIVRPVGNYGLPQWLRISIGLPQENAVFIAALKKGAGLNVIDKVVIVGVGLIGGSFALALKPCRRAASVVGMGGSEALARALELGIIDEAATSPAEALRGADLVLIAAPVAQTGAILASLLPHSGTRHGRHRRRQHQVRRGGRRARVRWASGSRSSCPATRSPGARPTGRTPPSSTCTVGKKVVLTPLPENAAADVDTRGRRLAPPAAPVHPSPHAGRARQGVRRGQPPAAFAGLRAGRRHRQQAACRPAVPVCGQRLPRLSPASPAPRPKCGATSAWPTSDALLGELDAYLAQLTHCARMLAAGDGAGLEAVYANAQRARRQWSERSRPPKRRPRPGTPQNKIK
jgi:prephenate dehydrogenase